MLRITNEKEVQNLPSLNAVRYIEGFCTSLDAKPTERIATGSNLIEVDTGNVFFFDEEAATWSALLILQNTQGE